MASLEPWLSCGCQPFCPSSESPRDRWCGLRKGSLWKVQPALLGSVVDELGLGRGDGQKEGGGTSLVVCWLDFTFHCRGHRFNLWWGA